jgi:chemotaxis protein MotB
MSNLSNGSKKKRKSSLLLTHFEEHGEPWLMSYADFMTLLCSFFILMMSMASFDDSKMSQLAINLAKYFNEKEMSKMLNNLEEIKNGLDKDLHFGTGVRTKLTENGLEIIFTGNAIFESGKADILPDAGDQLAIMIDLIKKRNRNYKVLVEGHTDNAVIKKGFQFASNRELSSARASRIVDKFEDAGFDPRNMIAMGYGETRPISPNNKENGEPIPENMQMNRRVVIKVLDIGGNKKDKGASLKEGAFFDDQKLIKN